NILNGSMFFDLRTLHGDRSLEERLKGRLQRYLSGDDVFLARTAANTIGFKPPLGLFGRLKTEKSGEHRGELDIKKAGIFAITEGLKVLALEAGTMPGG
ncbi:MAG: signal transduction protein, partial [Gemmatimonadetes bacterium]|nr:signal transduction protein [Gemmatimonadota bacterium]NIT68766.1 signal transduction protein [Gemmatimonadota bacterium]NIY37343.1 signal transduction protein [Gemmatimonadota bacterium]